jgi:hypothetical protein
MNILEHILAGLMNTGKFLSLPKAATGNPALAAAPQNSSFERLKVLLARPMLGTPIE